MSLCRGRKMVQVFVKERVNRERYSNRLKSPQPGPTVIRAGNYLAVVSLFVGAAFATFGSGSVEHRFGNLLLVGLLPAVGFYAAAYILGQLLAFAVKLCDAIMAPSSRYGVRFANTLLNRIGTHVSHWLTSGARPRLKARSSNGEELRIEVRRSGSRFWSLIIIGVSLAGIGFGWFAGGAFYWSRDLPAEEPAPAAAIHAVVEQIIGVESDGDANAKNKRSSATGLGQFLEETWLEMIRAHRPDLTKGRSPAEILELRRDAKIAREITARFTERNAEILRKQGLPVTPGTLYLAHFAGRAGAVAILSAMETADAALVMATADATGRTTREKLIKANPFLERFTVADLRNWARRKMQIRGL